MKCSDFTGDGAEMLLRYRLRVNVKVDIETEKWTFKIEKCTWETGWQRSHSDGE